MAFVHTYTHTHTHHHSTMASAAAAATPRSLPLVRNLAVCYKKDHRWYYVESLHAPRTHQVAVHEVNSTKALHPQRKPLYVDVADLFVVVRDRPHPVHIPAAADTISIPPRPAPKRAKTIQSHAQAHGANDADALYNYRKDVANGLLYKRFARDVAASHVHALLLDAPPRGSHHDDPRPNSSAFLIHKKGVHPANIVVANPDPGIVAQLAQMGCAAHTMLFNDFVLRERPGRPFNYIYLDACGAYETQLRDGLRRMFENHERWIADEAVLALVVCKRGAHGVLDAIRHDVDTWAHKFHFGRALLYIQEPENTLMHSITFHLTRLGG